MEYIEKSAAFRRTTVYVILKDGTPAGKVLVAYPERGEGRLRVSLWDFKHEVQNGFASGYGYDKTGGAIAGMKFRDITLTDNWKNDLSDAGYGVFQVV